MPEQNTKPVNKYLPPRPRRVAEDTPVSLMAMAEDATPIWVLEMGRHNFGKAGVIFYASCLVNYLFTSISGLGFVWGLARSGFC